MISFISGSNFKLKSVHYCFYPMSVFFLFWTAVSTKSILLISCHNFHFFSFTTQVFPLFSILFFQSNMLRKNVFSSLLFNHVKALVWWPRFHCCLNFFFQFSRNFGNMAKIFLHALLILKKYNMIAFVTLLGSAGEWCWWSVVTCH